MSGYVACALFLLAPISIAGPTVATPTTRAVPERKVRPKAFLVVMGVNDYQNKGLVLRYAANDARMMRALLSARLASLGYDVVVTALISDSQKQPDTAPDEKAATKENLRQALKSLVDQSWPDDVLIVSFSGHGYTDTDHEFYILPQEASVQVGNKPTSEEVKSYISSEELAAWLRKIDAGEMAMVIDACHSAAAVDQPWFKPGPLGNRGLGQLAYDKRMRVLAASQVDTVAIESENLHQGLLTYALIHDGLMNEKGIGRDGRITLSSWLAYGAERVPDLHARIVAGRPLDDENSPSTTRPGSIVPAAAQSAAARAVIIDQKTGKAQVTAKPLMVEAGISNPNAFQTPQLYDFSKGRDDIVLGVRKSKEPTDKSSAPISH